MTKKNREKAVTFISESGFREIRNWKELNQNVSKIFSFLKEIKIKKKENGNLQEIFYKGSNKKGSY